MPLVAANDSFGKLYTSDGATPMTPMLSIFTGMSAGATESIIVTPFEGVKIRVSDSVCSLGCRLAKRVEWLGAKGLEGW